MTEAPEVTRLGVLDLQVCVPHTWDDDKIIGFAEREYPCGTSCGWFIRKEGNKRLDGHPERVECASRDGYVHVMLEA
jgi:hypothetical protein